jgi:hypothetical protein
METKIIKGQKMKLINNPVVGQKVWIDVIGNEVYNEFTYMEHYPEVGDEETENWEPETWKFEGTGTFYHYPELEEFQGYVVDEESN